MRKHARCRVGWLAAALALAMVMFASHAAAQLPVEWDVEETFTLQVITTQNLAGTGNAAHLTWGVVAGATHYRIGRYEESTGNFFQISRNPLDPDEFFGERDGGNLFYKDSLGGEGLPADIYHYTVLAMETDPETRASVSLSRSNTVRVEFKGPDAPTEEELGQEAEDKDHGKLVITGATNVKVRENSTEPVGDYFVAYEDGTDASDAILEIDDWGEGGLFTWNDDAQLSFIDPPDYENPLDRRGRNVYRVRLLASEPGSTGGRDSTDARLLVRVTVRNVDDILVNLCNRTEAIQRAIVHAVRKNLQSRGINEHPGCHEVTTGQLARIRRLTTIPAGWITGLQPGDFADLGNLTSLWIGRQSIGTLPAGVFSGLDKLEVLILTRAELASLDAGVFDDLPSLTKLDLSDNRLASIPEGVFDGLPATLEELELNRNRLESLPADLLDGLSASFYRLDIGRNSPLDTDFDALLCGLAELGPGTRCLHVERVPSLHFDFWEGAPAPPSTIERRDRHEICATHDHASGPYCAQ